MQYLFFCAPPSVFLPPAQHCCGILFIYCSCQAVHPYQHTSRQARGLSSPLPAKSSPPAHPSPPFLAHCSFFCWLACAATASCLLSSRSSLLLLKCQLFGAVIMSPASPASPVGAHLRLTAARAAVRLVCSCKPCSTAPAAARAARAAVRGRLAAVGSSHGLDAGIFLCSPAGQLLPQHLPGAVLCVVIGVAPSGGHWPDHILRAARGELDRQVWKQGCWQLHCRHQRCRPDSMQQVELSAAPAPGRILRRAAGG